VCFLVPCSRSPKFERQDHTETHNLASCGAAVLGGRDTSDQVDGYSFKQSYNCCKPARGWIRVSSVVYDLDDPRSDTPELRWRVVGVWASKSPSQLQLQHVLVLFIPRNVNVWASGGWSRSPRLSEQGVAGFKEGDASPCCRPRSWLESPLGV